MKKKFNLILLILIALCILGSNLLVGSPIQENFIIIYISISIIGIITIIIDMFWLHQFSIIQNKLDIAVLVLMFASMIPLIFQTDTSLNDTVYSIFKYISVFILYYLAKGIAKVNKKSISYLTNIVMIGAIFLVILGIDDLTSKNFLWLTNKLEVVSVFNIEKRMFSTFGYANSFAAYMGFVFLLTMGQFLNNKKYNYLYVGICFTLLSAILLSYSRSTLIILMGILLVYFILLKDKEKRIKLVEATMITGIVSIMYLKLFENAIANKNYMIIWGGLIGLAILCGCLQKGLDYLNVYLIKIKAKHFFLTIAIGSMAVVLFIAVGLTLTKPLVLFNDSNSKTEFKHKITKIEPSSSYHLEFNLTAKSKTENINIYKIEIVEENQYGDTVKVHKIELNNFNGKKEIEIETSNETKYISIYFKSTQKYAQNGFIVEKLLVNGKEYPLQYQYLPITLVNRIKEINIENQAMIERMVISKDALQLIKDNWISGMGGNSWQYRYPEVQSYYYSVKQIHCYIIQIFFEFGILGFLSILGIIISIGYYGTKLIKNQKQKNDRIQNLTILMAIAFIFLHSFMDFDMTFMLILLTTFLYLGFLSSNNNEYENSKHYLSIHRILSLILIVLSMVVIYCNTVCLVIDNQLIKYKKTEKEYMEILNTGIQLLPYNSEYKINKVFSYNMQNETEIINAIKLLNQTEPYHVKTMEAIERVILIALNQEDEHKQIDNLQYIYNVIQKQFEIQDLSVENNLEKNQLVYNIANKIKQKSIENKSYELQEVVEQFYQLIEKNYTKNRENMLNHEKNRYSYEKIEKAVTELDEIYKNSMKESRQK